MHPYLRGLKPQARKIALRGHGGGSETTPVTWVRLIAALKAGKITDWDVYDSVTSSGISRSPKNRSPEVPCLCRFRLHEGKWKTAKPREIT